MGTEASTGPAAPPTPRRRRPALRTLAAALVVALLAAACTSDTADPTDDAPADDGAGDVSSPAAEPATETPEGRVQDLLLITSLTTVTPDGEVVELLPPVLDGLRDDLDDPLDLGDGVTFHPAPALDPAAVEDDGTPRSDIDVVAGLLETPDGEVLLVIGASDPAQHRSPIGHANEHAVLDMTYLGDLLAPGDPLFVEHAFGQTLPPDDAASEAGLTTLEVFASRLAAGAVDHLAVAHDGGTRPALLTQAARVVEGSTKVETPFKAQPMLDGFRQGTRPGRGGGLAAVRRFFQRFGDGARTSLDLIVKNLQPDPPPNPNPPQRPRCRFLGKGGGVIGYAKCTTGHGDPHFVTMDGLRYSYQGVGEFVAVRGDGVEVQMRTAAQTPDVSQIVAVAIGTDGHVIEVVQQPEPAVLVDGAAIDPEDLRGDGTVFGTVRIHQQLGRIHVTLADGIIVSVGRNGGRVDPRLTAMSLDVAVPLEDPRRWVGFGGDGDDDPDNDLTTRAGEVIALPPDPDDLRRFGDSWRLSDEESLFTYAAGESTATFTDLAAPRTVRSVATLDPDRRRFAATVCQLAGVVDATILEQCTLDVALTGDLGYLAGSLWTDAVVRGQLDPPGGGEAPPALTDLALPDEVVWATVFPDDLAEPLGEELVASADTVLVRTRDGDATTLHALDPSDGRIRWSTPAASVPAPALTDDGTVVLLTDDRGGEELLALDPTTGARLAATALGELGRPHQLVAIADDGVALVHDTEVAALDAATLTPRWRFTTQVALDADAVRVGDALVVAGGLRGSLVVHHLDAATGAVIGQVALPSLGSGTTRLTAAGETRVAVLSRTLDVITGLALTDGDPEVIWTTRIGDDDRLLSTPIRLVATGEVLAGWSASMEGPAITGIGVDDGSVRWSWTPAGFAIREGPLAAFDGGLVARPSSVWLEVIADDGSLLRRIDSQTGDGREPENVGSVIGLPGRQRVLVAGLPDGARGAYVAAVDLP